MELFVGTLYCGENEFDECVAAIKSQSYQNFDHVIISGLPEKEAHHKLYKSFIDNADKFGILIKVDADTVINSSLLFEKIVEKFEKNSWLEVMNIGVLDFFTNEMIAAGIQIYRNTVRWDFDQETLFLDIPIMSPDHYLYDTNELAPAAVHCKNPSFPQAFHYGVHRGLKSIQKKHSLAHWKLLHKVWKNFLRTDDRRMGLAVLGAELVYAGEFEREDQNYTNPKMDLVLKRFQDLESKGIKREIIKLRMKNWGFLPGNWRRKILRKLSRHI